MMCGKWVAAMKRLGCLSAAMALGLGTLMHPSFQVIMALLEAAGATAKICGRNHPPQKASICFFWWGGLGSQILAAAAAALASALPRPKEACVSVRRPSSLSFPTPLSAPHGGVCEVPVNLTPDQLLILLLTSS